MNTNLTDQNPDDPAENTAPVSNTRSSFSQKASALVTTLLVLVVLSTIVVAFMQSMSVERSVARSAMNNYKAELVAEAGLNSFYASLRPLLANDLFIIVSTTNSNGIFSYAGMPTPTNGAPGRIIYTPLFTGALKVTNTNLALPAILNSGGGVRTNLPQLPGYLDRVSTEWVYVTNSNGETNGRYAYWAEDVSGYVDALKSGNTNGPGGMHIRSDGNNPKNIALYVALDPTNTSGISATTESVIANRQNILTTPTLLQIIPANAATNAMKSSIISGVVDVEQDLVPFGRGYASQGLPKANINEFVLNTNVSGIASYISTNLPSFASNSRSGAANPDTYLRNLSANIIDYADVDSNPTTGVDFRGVDSFPFVTTYYQQFHWRNHTGGSISTSSSYWYDKNGTWRAQVDVTTFVQIWNIHSKVINSGILQMHDIVDPANPSNIFNRYSIYAAGNETPIAPEPPGTPPKIIDFAANPLQPNQFAVFQFGPVTYDCDTGITSASPRPNLTGTSRPAISERDGTSGLDHHDSNYLVTFNGKLIDRPGSSTSSRIDRKQGSLDREGVNTGPDWRGFVVGLRYDSGFPIPYETVFVLGDPRGNMFIDQELEANDYDQNSSWWGRHFAFSTMIPNGSWFGQQTLPSIWPDGGADTQRAASIYELNPGTTGTDERLRCLKTPFDIPISSRPALETNKAPSRISNAGIYTNILELGNVYDPIKWRPDWIVKNSTNNAVPMDVTSMTNSWKSLDSIAMIAASNYVVPGSLRIGRAEYKVLNQDGLRSAQLLELFAVTNNPRLTNQSRININTANREALRALAMGLVSTNDPSSSPTSISFPNKNYTSQEAGLLFADTVISNRPFLTTAQLSWMTNSYGGFFGTTNQYGTNTPSQIPSIWNDSARENFFNMIYNLAHVRSRSYRIWIAAESIDTRGKPRSHVNRVFQVFLKPDRSSSGVITNIQPIVTYENSF